MSKRIKALALMLAVAIVLAMVPVNKVQAATTKQSTISANQTKRCRFSDQYDKIWFEFIAPSDGNFYVTVNKENVSDRGTFRVKLLDAQGEKQYYSVSGKGITTPSYGTKSGQKYYIVVENSYDAKDIYFNFKLNWNTSSVWENEPNESQPTAKPMSINTTYFGIPNESDKDYFCVKAPSNGYFVFTVAHNDVTETGNYSLTIYNAGAAEITHQTGKNLSTFKIGVKAGTMLYAMVKDSYGADNQVYKLTPYFAASESFEAEPNNSASEAKPIAYNSVYTGIIGNWNSDKADFYKFSVNTISQVNINFGPVDIAKTGNWRLYILNAKGKEADILYTNSNKTAKVKLSKGVYYIKVVNSYDADDKEYQLKITSKNLNFKSKKPVIKTASVKKYNGIFSNKKFVGCSLAKTVSGADGYEVSVASAKSMRKPFIKERIKAGGKKLKTEKYFSSKSKYFYVQVKPYIQDPFGNYIYGKKSAAKKVATKAK